MKKNIMMRLSAVLLVAVLLTTCVISGTWAKYVTTDNATDSARVAKWGVTIDLSGYDVFNETYDEKAGEYAVESTENVVAPGTEGELLNIKIDGTPEVAVEVKYEATLELNNWIVNYAVYCPIVITVDSTPYKFTGTSQAELDAWIDTVEAAINGYTKNYDAGTDLDTATTPSVSWAWDFSTSAENDVKDTALGDAAAAGNAATISLKIVVTVTQLDTLA